MPIKVHRGRWLVEICRDGLDDSDSPRWTRAFVVCDCRVLSCLHQGGHAVLDEMMVHAKTTRDAHPGFTYRLRNTFTGDIIMADIL